MLLTSPFNGSCKSLHFNDQTGSKDKIICQMIANKYMRCVLASVDIAMIKYSSIDDCYKLYLESTLSIDFMQQTTS